MSYAERLAGTPGTEPAVLADVATALARGVAQLDRDPGPPDDRARRLVRARSATCSCRPSRRRSPPASPAPGCTVGAEHPRAARGVGGRRGRRARRRVRRPPLAAVRLTRAPRRSASGAEDGAGAAARHRRSTSTGSCSRSAKASSAAPMITESPPSAGHARSAPARRGRRAPTRASASSTSSRTSGKTQRSTPPRITISGLKMFTRPPRPEAQRSGPARAARPSGCAPGWRYSGSRCISVVGQPTASATACDPISVSQQPTLPQRQVCPRG